MRRSCRRPASARSGTAFPAPAAPARRPAPATAFACAWEGSCALRRFLEPREFVHTCKHAIQETIAMPVPQCIRVQRAAQPQFLPMQTLAAFVNGDALCNAVADVLQPAHVVKVVTRVRL